jgi:hypothetical protein
MFCVFAMLQFRSLTVEEGCSPIAPISEHSFRCNLLRQRRNKPLLPGDTGGQLLIIMRREPNWVDFGNLALNTVQVAQLAQLNSELGQLRAAALDRQRREALENRLRQFAFEQEQQLEHFLTQIGTSPLPACVGMGVIRHNLRLAGIEPARFEQFSDKDRIAKVLRKLDEGLGAVSARLTPDEAIDAQVVVNLLTERNDLNELIGMQQLIEEVELIRDQNYGRWLKRNEELGQRPKGGLLQGLFFFTAGGFGLLAGLLVIAAVGFLFCGGEDLIPGALKWAALFRGGWWLFTWLSKEARPKNYRDWEDNQALHEKGVAQDQAEYERRVAFLPTGDRLIKLRSQFGERGAADYLKIRDEREEVISRVFRSVETGQYTPG